MNIDIKCFANLSDITEGAECNYREAHEVSLEENASVASAVREAGIEEKDVKVVFVNGRAAGMDQILRNGDRVALVPPAGGM